VKPSLRLGSGEVVGVDGLRAVLAGLGVEDEA
jgi:hypothetical protein